MGDFSSIDSFSQEFKNTAGSKLDYLILNAGVLNYKYKELDGLEATVKVNHLGTMKLCLELLDLINNTPNSKVLFLTSFRKLKDYIFYFILINLLYSSLQR